jgi:DegV family protein with EDD domain
MGVKIVTDSTSDLPKEVAAELGITVVPVNVHFGFDAFMDGVDMQADEFYHRLVTGSVLPTTSAPSPGLFQDCYQKLAEESQEIVSIHISTKLSGTYEAALAGKQEVGDRCRIEVIDSQLATIGLGLVAIAAAKAANQGATIDEVLKLVEESINGVYVVAAPDTLEFLQKGGRVGKAQAWLGSILSIKPLISLRDGEVVPLERVRTHSKAIARVYELLNEHVPARELSVAYSTDPEEANKLVAHLNRLFPEQPVYLSRFGAGLGTHLGPDSLAFATLK